MNHIRTYKGRRTNPKLQILFLLFFGLVLNSYSQSFNYTISIDSSQSYTILSGATALSPSEKWQSRYEIPTGFSAGAPQQVSILSNGFVIFNPQLDHALMAFYGFGPKIDSVAAWSRLSYLTTGTTGAKILKIEYMNVGQSDAPGELLSYQVWLHENGVFNVVVGPSTYEPAPGDTLSDTSQVVRIGLINRRMDANANGLFISGTPQDPVSTPLDAEHPGLAFLRSVPKRGYTYTFTPNQ